jgi:hypothetical protein
MEATVIKTGTLRELINEVCTGIPGFDATDIILTPFDTSDDISIRVIEVDMIKWLQGNIGDGQGIDLIDTTVNVFVAFRVIEHHDDNGSKVKHMVTMSLAELVSVNILDDNGEHVNKYSMDTGTWNMSIMKQQS